MILDPPRPKGKGLPDKPQRKPGSEPVLTGMASNLVPRRIPGRREALSSCTDGFAAGIQFDGRAQDGHNDGGLAAMDGSRGNLHS